jgi:hypothetical protein
MFVLGKFKVKNSGFEANGARRRVALFFRESAAAQEGLRLSLPPILAAAAADHHSRLPP